MKRMLTAIWTLVRVLLLLDLAIRSLAVARSSFTRGRRLLAMAGDDLRSPTTHAELQAILGRRRPLTNRDERAKAFVLVLAFGAASALLFGLASWWLLFSPIDLAPVFAACAAFGALGFLFGAVGMGAQLMPTTIVAEPIAEVLPPQRQIPPAPPRILLPSIYDDRR